MLALASVLHAVAYLQRPGSHQLTLEELSLCACLRQAGTPLTLRAAVRCLEQAGYEIEPVFWGEADDQALDTSN